MREWSPHDEVWRERYRTRKRKHAPKEHARISAHGYTVETYMTVLSVVLDDLRYLVNIVLIPCIVCAIKKKPSTRKLLGAIVHRKTSWRYSPGAKYYIQNRRFGVLIQPEFTIHETTPGLVSNFYLYR